MDDLVGRLGLHSRILLKRSLQRARLEAIFIIDRFLLYLLLHRKFKKVAAPLLRLCSQTYGIFGQIRDRLLAFTIGKHVGVCFAHLATAYFATHIIKATSGVRDIS